MQAGNELGGPAAAGGFSFQDEVTAIVYAHVLAGTDIGWLSHVGRGHPVAVGTESGGPGDDLRLETEGGGLVEVQARKGLRADGRFWTAIDSLSEGLEANEALHGVLVVCPSSSGSVRRDWAQAVLRTGEGARDRPSMQQEKLATFLENRGRDPESVCRRLRIETVAAVEGQEADIREAQSQLVGVCNDSTQVARAWGILCRVARRSMGHRGRRTVALLVADLESARVGVRVDANGAPASVVRTMIGWALATTNSFSVLGARKELPTDRAWLRLRAKVLVDGVADHASAEEAVRAYREMGAESEYRHGLVVDANTIGFFRRCSVVVGGPGSGKSLLLKVLARELGKAGVVSLRVPLRDVARRVQNGSTVTESLLSVGLGASGVPPRRLEALGSADLVLLCDGLDECGGYAARRVAEELVGMAVSRPSWRFVVTTRPIGYRTAALSAWRHYEILPPGSGRVVEEVSRLVARVSGCATRNEELSRHVEAYLARDGRREMASRSPLLLGLLATLYPEREGMDGTRAALYERMLRRVQEVEEARLAEFEGDDSVVQQTVLNCLGWVLGRGALLERNEVVARCAGLVADLFDQRLPTAKSLTVKAIRYWTATGLIEIVRHGDQEFVLFVHRTLGEYAAARHLLEVPDSEARGLLSASMGEPDFDEVLGFVLETGRAELFVRLVVERAAAKDVTGRIVDRACRILGRKDSNLTDDVRRELIGKLVALAKERSSDVAYMIGSALAKNGMHEMPYLREEALELVASDVATAKLVGWTVLVCHFREGLDCVELRRVIDTLGQFAKGGPRRKRTAVLAVGEADAMDVYRLFLIGALNLLLREADRDRQDELVATVTSADGIVTLGFADDLSKILLDIGRDDLASRLPRLRGLGTGFMKALEAVFDVDWAKVDDRYRFVIREVVLKAFSEAAGSGSDSIGFPNLGAFFKQSGFWETPSTDVAVWDRDADLSAVHKLMRAVAYILKLPMVRMAAEAAQMLERQTAEPGGELGSITQVDPEESDWGLADSAPIGDGEVSALRNHASQWVRSLANRIARIRNLTA